jgi:hypothetical protein
MLDQPEAVKQAFENRQDQESKTLLEIYAQDLELLKSHGLSPLFSPNQDMLTPL